MVAAVHPFSCLDHLAHDAWRELRGTPFRDDAFTDKDWQRHFTWRRYIPEPQVLGVVILTLAPIWLWSVFVSLCLGLYATFAEPAGWPNVSDHMELLTPFTLTSFALSLLMLFKTNSAYGRWWEARTLWGSGYITVRSILRLTTSFVGHTHPELVPPMYRWTAAILPALAAYLRQMDHYLIDHLEGVLLPEELAFLCKRLAGGIPPIAVLQVLSRLLDRASLPDIERQQLEHLLNQCDIIIGGCERILRQPIPYAYNRHTHRFIICYITFLPFAFWPRFGWATLPIMAVMTFLICGLENVGVQIEEPHRVLPLNGICSGTLRALRLMMADQDAASDMAAFAATSTSKGASMAHLSMASMAAPAEVAVSVGTGDSNATATAAAAAAAADVAVGALSKRIAVGALSNSGLRLTPRQVSAGHLKPVVNGDGQRLGQGQIVELSVPSAVSTPATARPVSPDVFDATAANGAVTGWIDTAADVHRSGSGVPRRSGSSGGTASAPSKWGL